MSATHRPYFLATPLPGGNDTAWAVALCPAYGTAVRYACTIKKKGATVNTLHPETQNNECVSCERCDDEVNATECVNFNGATWCASCYDEDTVSCDRCGHIVVTDDAQQMHDDAYWCESCYEHRGGYCEGCDSRFPLDELDCDLNDELYCSYCHDDGCGHWTRRYDNTTIYEYETNVLYVLSHKVDFDALLFGFELELNCCDDDDRYDAARTFLDRCGERGIVKCDGSIGDGDTGIELVTLPMSLDNLKSLACSVLVNDTLHAGAFADSSCGMHVHISRKPIPCSVLAKLLRFIHNPANFDFMDMIAGRELRGSRWAPTDQRSTQWRSLYNRNMRTLFDSSRYSALNITNDSTIEFRIFASSTSAARVCANLEACAALLAYCGAAARPWHEAERHDAFASFVMRSHSAYPYLANFLAAHTQKELAPCASLS